MTAPRALAILTVKNEGAFLIEWLAHNRMVGFTDFLVFSNDCSDGTDAMLDRLAQMGWLTHIRNDGAAPQGPQWAALRSAADHPLLRAADWAMVIDIDEFVTIKLGDGTLGALWAALPGADAIAMTWRMFGNCGKVAFEDRPVTETFVRAAPSALPWPWRAGMIKTLYRPAAGYAKPGVHRPRALDADAPPPFWVDGSGRRLPDSFRTTRLFTDPGLDCHTLVQLNHYALGWMESYLVKADRGRANREASAFDMGYWVERNFCAVEDRTAQALAARAAPLRAGLHADPVLGALHRAAVDWRRARFAALMADEAWRGLFGRLMLAPPTRVLTPEEVRVILRHAPRKRG